jgi:sulfite exporter TauE/SafE
MFLTDSLYILMFTSGLLGGFGHCIGMCGPVVVTYTLHVAEITPPLRTPGEKKRAASILPHLLYNLGRITTYSTLGGIMGATGSFVGVMKSVERYQHLTLALIGVIMVAMGLALAGWLPLFKRKEQGTGETGNNNSAITLINRAVRSIAGTGSLGAFFPMGLVLAFIPCGLLYTALISAAGAGLGAKNELEGFLRGMLLLFLFGLGTAPAMFLLGQVVSMKREWLRNKLYRASAIIMVAMGIMFIYRAIR